MEVSFYYIVYLIRTIILNAPHHIRCFLGIRELEEVLSEQILFKLRQCLLC